MYIPMTSDDIADIIQIFLSKKALSSSKRQSDVTPLQFLGSGSKQKILPDKYVEQSVSLEHMQKISFYEPDELVLRVQPGIWIQDIQKLLASEQQMLPFEPMNYDYLLYGTSQFQEMPEYVAGTIGGMVATAQTGPRRIGMGGVRDHILGVEVVSGRGEIFRSGGRVMKNVTGYDLPKLMAGAFGRLGVMTEVTLRVLPAPELTQTCVISVSDLTQAVLCMRHCQQSALEVTAASYLPAKSIAKLQNMLVHHGHIESDLRDMVRHADGLIFLRLEGKEASVVGRSQVLRNICDQTLALAKGSEIIFTNDVSRLIWSFIRDVRGLGGERGLSVEDVVWRICLPPAKLSYFHHALCHKLIDETQLSYQVDWAGGLIWVAFPMLEEGGQAIIQQLLSEIGGSASLIRAPLSVRHLLCQRHLLSCHYPVYQGVIDLQNRIRQQFDPYTLFTHSGFVNASVPISTEGR